MLVSKAILANRKPSVDVYRGIAILLVVLFHFDHLVEIGFIGVDLFFVISGYLVSRVLLDELKAGEVVNWRSFMVKRFTKILPSYYFFILGGTVIARIFLLNEHSTQVIGLAELPRYLFFYLNYNMTFSWSFELAWSLCVEEHFYLFLILLFIGITAYGFIKRKALFLKRVIYIFIAVSIAYKFIGFHYGWDIYNTTQSRMDALFLGVLLSFQEINEEKVKQNAISFVILGLAILALITTLFYTLDIEWVKKALLHTLVPIGFYFLIRGSLFMQFKGLKFMRIMAYFSYNWYLWHALTAYMVLNLFDFPKWLAFILYFCISFVVAILTTKLIEEPVLRLRKKILT